MNYSIVIPVYNSERLVEKTVQDTILFMQTNFPSFEIILINDGSTDDSWVVIERLAKQYKHVIAINLLKNYGQHSAVLCGFKQARGEFIITMDDDGQNPPKEIAHLVNKINEGYDCVWGVFKKKKHSLHRRLGSKVINYLNSKIFNKPTGLILSNFRIAKKEIVQRVINYKTSYPYIPGLLLMFSGNVANIEVEHRKRELGKSNYNTFKILALVSRLLINYSSFPLMLLTGIGIIISIFSFSYGGYVIIKQLIVGSQVQGWTTTVFLLSFFNGFLILMIGLLGSYVSRILRQTSTSDSFQIMNIVGDE